ncbi:WD40 repeat-like protein [Byssothecium circinans]|uniref:WD40 repeat-like protein n=1 Tax=Byssothecium circinans TaxID=147558 RepID=A0A6A5UAV7_9PLEO|nr:WD40 repeat-like protein [Byssothecium circinans]
MSDAEVHHPPAEPQAPITPEYITPQAFVPPTGRVTFTGPLRDEESDFLLFLKEVKKLPWKEITKEFNEYYAGRAYTKLQSYYSMKLNKRDRAKDPPRLRLPARYSGEAVINWTVVHAENPGPVHSGTTGREAAILQAQLSRTQRPDPVWQKPVVIPEPIDYSSGAEQVSHRERPRRAVPRKDYTWPRRHRQSLLGEVNDELEIVESADMSMQMYSEEPPELLNPAPEKAIAVDNTPISMEEYAKEDALLALSLQKQTQDQKLPYLSSPQRLATQDLPLDQEWDQLCSRDWQGSLIHVDFDLEEFGTVEKVVCKVLNIPEARKRRGRRHRLQSLLDKLAEPKLLRIANELRRYLQCRDGKSIAAFLEDARVGQVQFIRPRIERLAAARPNKDQKSDQKLSTTSMLRQRELGRQSRRGWSAASRPLSYQMKNKVYDTLGPAFTYTGASSDVHAVAWSPDSQSFAGGAICVDDPHSMQYNRPNNLLYGDVTCEVIHELGRHRVERPRPGSGPNSTHAMHASQDPKLYKSVSSVAFSPNGRYMFSGGYDHTVCVWETRLDGSQPEWRRAWRHKAPVDMIAVNSLGLLATASKKPSTNAVKTIKMIDDDPEHIAKESFSSQKATTRPDFNILPTALQFSPRFENLLLAGFGANVRTDGRDLSGDICLWDVNNPQAPLNIHGSAFNVFDLSFHNRNNWFAVGCVAGQNVNRGTRSVLRLYDGSSMDNRYSSAMELECKALDMNDVVWCPGDDFLIAAGCTSGRAYIWDVRWPDHFLREVAHSKSLMPLDDYLDREITDTGIRFLSWGANATRLYTGSSDGVVKVWDVTKDETETFVKDLITTNSGIMSGAFSPDKSRLILGEVNGSINVLEVGREDCSSRDAERLRFVPYIDEDDDDGFQDNQLGPPPHQSESGVAAAAALLRTSQMVHVPMGSLPIRQTVQGPNYLGPFDSSIDAPFLREQSLNFQLKFSSTGPQCSLPSCKDVVKVTDEETGDSGRSADRIPDELRRQWEAGSHSKLIPGKAHCTACGRAARPPSSSTNDPTVLCERCSFACIRCGALNKVLPAATNLTCTSCECEWEIGALGYECIHDPGKAVQLDVPKLNRYARELMEQRIAAREQLGDNASFGDEVNALTDYYLGLAVERAEEPLL